MRLPPFSSGTAPPLRSSSSRGRRTCPTDSPNRPPLQCQPLTQPPRLFFPTQSTAKIKLEASLLIDSKQRENRRVRAGEGKGCLEGKKADGVGRGTSTPLRARPGRVGALLEDLRASVRRGEGVVGGERKLKERATVDRCRGEERATVDRCRGEERTSALLRERRE